MVQELLSRGRENAVTTEALLCACNLKNKRDLTKQIAKEREEGAIICSTTSDGGGYYLPENKEELRKFVNSMNSRGRKIFRVTKSAREMLKEMESNNNGECWLDKST